MQFAPAHLVRRPVTWINFVLYVFLFCSPQMLGEHFLVGMSLPSKPHLMLLWLCLKTGWLCQTWYRFCTVDVQFLLFANLCLPVILKILDSPLPSPPLKHGSISMTYYIYHCIELLPANAHLHIEELVFGTI